MEFSIKIKYYNVDLCSYRKLRSHFQLQRVESAQIVIREK